MSINSLLFTSRDSLIANQFAVSVTGANIANVNTDGYSRQRADMVTTGAVNLESANAQVGVSVSQVIRIYDSYIDSQLVQQQQASGYSDTMLKVMENIEAVVDETNGGGISEYLDNFWSAWDDLALNPTGQVERNSLISSAETLTETINSDSQKLDAINTELNTSIADVVSRINDKVQEIADINTEIIKGGTNTGDMNAILDKRAAALQELGSMINMSYLETSDGTVNVYMTGGKPLLLGTTAQTLSAVVNDGTSSVYRSNSSEDINESITGGELGAFLELQQTTIPKYMDYLNNFTSALANRVNEMHSSGYDGNGDAGGDFFTFDSANPSSSITVTTSINNDINKIAASASVLGDGENATSLAAIRDELLSISSVTSSLGSYLATMVGEVGRETANAKTNSEHQTTILDYLKNQRESVSGVSIDEEMIQLIKYQTGYTAAGKLCSMVNEMLDTLMNILN